MLFQGIGEHVLGDLLEAAVYGEDDVLAGFRFFRDVVTVRDAVAGGVAFVNSVAGRAAKYFVVRRFETSPAFVVRADEANDRSGEIALGVDARGVGDGDEARDALLDERNAGFVRKVMVEAAWEAFNATWSSFQAVGLT
jgi:hypothetical protein